MRPASVIALLLTLLLAFTAFGEDKAVCAVCGPREGSGPEPVKARATYQGKEYAFCSPKCKVEFLKNPAAFLVTDEGTPAPAFKLKAFDGRTVSLDEFRGQVVLLDFWGTYCIPCVKALPDLQALHDRFAKAGFAVIGVTVDDRAPQVMKATKAAGVTYPIAEGSAAVWGAYKINTLPSLVLVGPDGLIVRRYGGEADRAAMFAEIEKAIAQ